MSLTFYTAAMASVFNLSCSGTEVRVGDAGVVGEREFAETYRVDLENYIYCAGECDFSYQIAHIDQNLIQLPKEAKFDIIVNRTTGDYYSVDLRISNLTVMRNGTCKKVAFTGFPDRKF